MATVIDNSLKILHEVTFNEHNYSAKGSRLMELNQELSVLGPLFFYWNITLLNHSYKHICIYVGTWEGYVHIISLTWYMSPHPSLGRLFLAPLFSPIIHQQFQYSGVLSHAVASACMRSNLYLHLSFLISCKPGNYNQLLATTNLIITKIQLCQTILVKSNMKYLTL